MVGINFPFMVRQAHHERKIMRFLNPNPFALSCELVEQSKGRESRAASCICYELGEV